MKQIFLISGKRTCGKDITTTFIKKYFEELGLKVNVASFANEFKRLFCLETGLDFDRMLNDYKYKEIYRDKMVDRYTEMHEQYGEDYFCNLLLENIKTTQADIFIIPDFRLKIEMKMFLRLDKKEYEVKTIRVNAILETRIKRGWIQKPCDKGFTETELDDYKDFDIIIDNDGTLDELEKKIYEHLDHMSKKIETFVENK